MYTKNMLVGIALAAVMAVGPALAADKSAAPNGLRSDSRAPGPVQERTEPLPLSTEQLDSVKGGLLECGLASAACTPTQICKGNVGVGLVAGIGAVCL
jgi:hypothetical protein